MLNEIAAKSGTFSLGGELQVNRLGFGAMRITGPGVFGPPADREECKRVLRRAVELGVNFIDTADSYGPNVSEDIIAEALHPYPAGLVIGTKSGYERPGPDVWVENCHPRHLRRACEGSLKRLRVERIDLYQLHRIDAKVPEEDQFGTFEDLIREGKIRLVGLSEVAIDQIERARATLPIVSVQNRYNAFDREWEPVLEHCEHEHIAFIPWYPLAAGKIQGAEVLQKIARRMGASTMQVALAWLLARSPVMLPIPGTSRVEHLVQNVEAALLELSPEDFDKISNTGKAAPG